MAEKPTTYLPCDYDDQEEIYPNVYLIDDKYYYTKLEWESGGSQYCELYLVGVAQAS